MKESNVMPNKSKDKSAKNWGYKPLNKKGYQPTDSGKKPNITNPPAVDSHVQRPKPGDKKK